MAKGGVELKILDKDMRKALRSVRFWGGKTLEQCSTEVNKATLNTAADAKQNVKDNGSVSTSLLINSIESTFNKLRSTGEVLVGAAYGGYLEFGRKAGGFPPLAPLETWIKKKGIESDPKKIKSAAFLIGRSIAKNGTKPRPYLIPSWRKNANLLVKNLKLVLRQSGKNKKL
jgi:hypothetical protein